MVRVLQSLAATAACAVLLMPAAAGAELLNSSHYKLDTGLGASVGGSTSSTDYSLTDTGGQTANGAGASASYMLGTGFVRDLPQSIELSVLPSGTYAYWPFDTGTGTRAYDMSTNADDATLMNAPSWTTGIVGNAVTLNGTSQYATTANFITGPSTFTEELWFKSGTSAGGYLMGFGNAASGASATLDRVLYMQPNGQITFGVKPASTYQTVTSSASYNDGSSWHFVAATLSTAGMSLYVDGVKQGSNASVATAGSYSGYWRMGYDNLSGWPNAPTTGYLAGSIDEARVYTKALTSTELAGDYTAGENGLHNAFTLPGITPGQSQTYSVDAIVRTNAPGYDLFMQEPSPLARTGGGATFPGISGTISSPIPWVEGTTKGLGFTLTAGYALESSWGTSPSYKYASVPSTLTQFHDRAGTSPLDGAAETTTIQYRADASSSQQQGTYSTTIVYTATMKP